MDVFHQPRRMNAMNRTRVGLPVVLVLIAVVATGVWLRAQTQPTVPPPTVSPLNIVVNTPVPALFTVRIPTPTLNPTTVQLLRVDQSGNTIRNLGSLNDTGKNGDAVADDRIFTARVTLNEPTVGKAFYRLTAAFKGSKQNVLSTGVPIQVLPGASWNPSQSAFQVPVPQGWQTLQGRSDFAIPAEPSESKRAYQLLSPSGSTLTVIPDGDFDSGPDIGSTEACRAFTLSGKAALRCDYSDEQGIYLSKIEVSGSTLRIEIRVRTQSDIPALEQLLASIVVPN